VEAQAAATQKRREAADAALKKKQQVRWESVQKLTEEEPDTALPLAERLRLKNQAATSQARNAEQSRKQRYDEQYEAKEAQQRSESDAIKHSGELLSRARYEQRVAEQKRVEDYASSAEGKARAEVRARKLREDMKAESRARQSSKGQQQLDDVFERDLERVKEETPRSSKQK